MAVKKKTKAKTGKTAKTGKKRVAKAQKKAPAKKAPAKKGPMKKAAAKTAEKAPVKATSEDKASAKAVKKAPAPPVEKAAAKSTRPKETGKLRVTLRKSVHGRLASHQACAMGLGLRRRHQTVEIEDTPCTRGMINRIRYMLEVEGQ